MNKLKINTWNLEYKVMALTAALLILLGGILSLFFISKFQSDQTEWLKKSNERTVAILSQASIYAVTFSKKEDISPLADWLLNNSEVHSIVIMNKSNEIVYENKSTGHVESEHLIEFEHPIHKATFETDYESSLSVDIGGQTTRKPERIGKAIISVSLLPFMYEQSSRARLGIIIATILITISLGLLYLLGWFQVAKPFRKICSTLNSIKDGNLNVILSLKQGGNVGDIASDINDMVLSMRTAKEELESSRELAEQANQAKSRFLRTLSHDLRHPLSQAEGMLTLALKDQDIDALQKMYITSALGSNRKQLRLIDQILFYAQLESESLQVGDEKEFNGTEIIKESIEGARFLARQKGIELKWKNTGTLKDVFIFSHIIYIQKITDNLISNAIKYTDEGRILVSSLWEEHSASELLLTLSVKDTGKGIASEDKSKIFNEFHQLGDHFEREGSGLGLNIIKRLVDALDGEISVSSSIGIGTEFVCKLVYKYRKQNENALTVQENIKKTNLNGVALLIDDCEDFHIIVKGYLKDYGIHLDSAKSGEEGLKCYKEKNYDYVILDCQMNGMSGFEVAKKIREIEVSNNLTPVLIIAISANVIGDIEKKCIEMGMSCYLSKPFTPEKLHQKIVDMELKSERETNILPLKIKGL